ELELAQRPPGSLDRQAAARVDDDQFRDQGVVIRSDRRPIFDERVDADAGPERRPEPLDAPGRRSEAARRVLGVDPQLDRVAAARSGAAAVPKRFARCDPDLLADEVEPGDELGDRMLDLEACVQLDEGERAVRPDEELEGAGVAVADVPRGALGRGLHRLALLVVERGRRRLLDQLLMAALDRALALAAGEDVAVVIAEHLDLDVTGRRDHLLDVERAVPK